MANADGGMIIYGIKEKDHLPDCLDAGICNNTINREWIENILLSNISPSISNVQIIQIPKNVDFSYYVLDIPKSFNGPHQSSCKRYYKRYNFKSCPMDDYEINDIRLRHTKIEHLVSVDIEVDRGLFCLVIENIGTLPAENVTFRFEPEISWISGKKPRAFEQGIKYLPPRRKLSFLHSSAFEALNTSDPSRATQFTITTSYMHPQTKKMVSETFYFDLYDFLGSGYAHDLTEEIKKGLSEIVKALRAK